MQRRSHSLTPLFAQLATILVASVLIIVIVLLTTGTTNRRSDRAAREGDAALIAARMDLKVHVAEGFLEQFPEGGQVDLATALDVHDAMLAIDEGATELAALVNTPETQEIQALAQDAQVAVRSFFVTQATGELQAAIEALATLNSQMELRIEEFVTLAEQDREALKSTARWSQWLIVGTCLVAALIAALTSFVIGQAQRHALLQTQHERDDLANLTSAIQKRNDQFAALYQVVSEITDNLSMRYVVNTAVSEAGKLVKAEHVELRLLENDVLTPRGLMRDGEIVIADGAPLPLGIGLAGKAAKRGRTLRLDAGAAGSMADDEKIDGIESGLIVPLIVGARVVGTLACWSTELGKFDTDDERIIELMASQVATAVAAADLHASSEQRASHDALTGLPNRRRLVEDTLGFQQALDAEEKLAVAMFDIDHFKRFNDDFGHKVGDVTLQKVAEVMRGAVRDSDHLYRYGGEEFLLVLSNVEAVEAVQLVERVRRAVERTILTGENLEPVGPVTISAGIAVAPANGDDLTMLIVLADEALYRSKEDGRNRVTLSPVSTGLDEAA